MKHPNAQVLEKLYADLARNEWQLVLDACAENATFQISGKSRLAGKYQKADLPTLAAKIRELPGFRLEAHDVMASDRHGVALVSVFFTRNGKEEQLRAAHIWRMENGRAVAWYDYPRDLYQFDAAFN